MKLHRKYNSDTKKVNIQLKKKFPWWSFLFLLLLPLLLFINIPKKINLQTIIDINRQQVSDIDLSYNYSYRQFFNFSEFVFNYKKEINETTISDSQGVVTLDKKVKVSVFQYLFYPNDSISFSASIECSEGAVKEILPRNKFKDTLILELQTDQIELINFLTVDAETDEPLFKADVEISYQYLNSIIKDTIKTIETGEAEFCKIPSCCEILVVGKRYGYVNDTLRGIASEFIGQPKPTDQVRLNRTLYLQPVKEIIRFYVNELKTHQPIIGANADLLIDNVEKQSTKTNINGNGIFVPGEGEFNETHIIKNMQIHAYHRFYNDTMHPNRPVRVEHFNKGSDLERTAFLRPKKDSYTFRNTINDKCGNPLSGVKNYIKIETSAGNVRRDTVLSNANGAFSISDLFYNDRIFILSVKNGFDDNDFTVDGQFIDALFDNTSSCEQDLDIPLYREEPPIPVSNCDEMQASGSGNSVDVRSIDLVEKGEFSITYDMKDTYPDRIIVYCGSGTDGDIIFEDYRINANYVVLDNYNCNTSIITIKIIPDDSDNTAWDYLVTCPE